MKRYYVSAIVKTEGTAFKPNCDNASFSFHTVGYYKHYLGFTDKMEDIPSLFQRFKENDAYRYVPEEKNLKYALGCVFRDTIVRIIIEEI